MSTSSSPLRVAHVAFSLRTGGMERLLVEFARHHDRTATQLSFYCLTDEGRPAEDIRAAGRPVESLHKAAGFRLRTVWQLARRFRRERIDVVHTHNSGAMIYGALASRFAGVSAVVHTRHGQRFGAGRRQTLTFAQMTKLVDRVVSVSRDGACQSLREGIAPSRVQTIWNGIDLSRFAFRGAQPGRPAILVARMVPEKDLPTLLAAVELVVQREPTFQLRLVGDGPALAAARARAARGAWGRHLEFLGERSDVADLLADSSLFVLSSRTEGISLTLLEAMASGLPVVATRVGGNTEVVDDESTGLLVPVAHPALLADAIVRLWRSPSVATDMGAAGRRRVETHFDVKGMIRQYESLYREVVDQRRSPSASSCARVAC
ncbi:MAG: glycosyltransferase [Pirellulales bacterium]